MPSSGIATGLVLVPAAAVAVSLGVRMLRLNDSELHALALSLFAGLSTTIGAAIAVVRLPSLLPGASWCGEGGG